MNDLKGKVAVITGASRGIGAGLADRFLQRGLSLGLCARNMPAEPRDAAIQDPQRRNVISCSLDVSDHQALEGFTDRVIQRFQRIDLWVNNAGILDPIGPLRDLDPEHLENNFRTNITGVALGCRLFARHVRTRPGGGILVNITSGAALTPYEGWAPYCSSKAAVNMLTEIVAVEESDAGLRAYAVAPGVVDTSMQKTIRACTPEQFPAVGRFIQIAQSGSFSSPVWVADQLLELAFTQRPYAPTRDHVVVRLPILDT
ncbi:MAG: SDR family oxidoreductase [Acidimicrobiales bacterium]